MFYVNFCTRAEKSLVFIYYFYYYYNYNYNYFVMFFLVSKRSLYRLYLFVCLFVEITYFGVMIVLMVILFYNIFDFYLLTLQKELLVVFYALTL